MLQRIRKENTDVYHYNSLTNDELWVLKEALSIFISNNSHRNEFINLATNMYSESNEMLKS